MKILITGAKGMLAQAIIEKFKNHELILTDSKELDITNKEQVLSKIKEIKPDYIINCAAYTAVDKAEEDRELAKLINQDGPQNLAKAAQLVDAVLVHISTDYVFDGEKDVSQSYKEDEKIAPVTVYGLTKAGGEKEIEENCSKYYIFRTAWLYGEGNNFVRTMLKLGSDRNKVCVVNDQHGSPTYTVDLADIIYQAINKKIPYGIYHTTNQGFTTWYDFTKLIFEMANIDCEVTPVTTSEYIEMMKIIQAKRPKNSQLSKDKILSFDITIPTYQDGLKRYLDKELLNK